MDRLEQIYKDLILSKVEVANSINDNFVESYLDVFRKAYDERAGQIIGIKVALKLFALQMADEAAWQNIKQQLDPVEDG